MDFRKLAKETGFTADELLAMTLDDLVFVLALFDQQLVFSFDGRKSVLWPAPNVWGDGDRKSKPRRQR